MEEWKPVVGYENRYHVSSHGSVRSFVCCAEGHTLKPSTSRQYGYRHVILCDGTTHCTKKVHHLVLEAFVGPRPPGMEAAHEDGNPRNNLLSNLRWSTSTANQADRVRHGTDIRGSDHRLAKLCEEDVIEIKQRRRAGETYRSIAVAFGVSHPLIIKIVQGKAWAHVEAA